jgi:AbrB family looped-hinge helix DNA binding protein
MAELVQVGKKLQITLPKSARDALGVAEGDYLELAVRYDEVILKSTKLTDKGQAWFRTKRWQAGETTAEEDIKAKHIQAFKDYKALVSFLGKQTARKSTKNKKESK